MKRKLSSIILTALLVLPGIAAYAEPPAKNVILLLTDGTGPEAWPLARWIKGAPLEVDSILTGAIKTYGADSIVTDSAPGATAFATGFKGTDKGISVGAWKVSVDAAKPYVAPAYVPLATLLEGAKLEGKATGPSHPNSSTPPPPLLPLGTTATTTRVGEQQVIRNGLVLSGRAILYTSNPRGSAKMVKPLGVLRSKGLRSDHKRNSRKAGRRVGCLRPDSWRTTRRAVAAAEPSLADMTGKASLLRNLRQEGRLLLFVAAQGGQGAHSTTPRRYPTFFD
jgi:alkaline phosphatase